MIFAKKVAGLQVVSSLERHNRGFEDKCLSHAVNHDCKRTQLGRTREVIELWKKSD